VALHRSGLGGVLWGDPGVLSEPDARGLVSAHLQRIASSGFSPTDAQIDALLARQSRESIRPMRGARPKPEPVAVDEPDRKRSYKKGRTKVWKVRVSEQEDAEAEEFALSQGIDKSEVLRRSVRGEVELARAVTASEKRAEQ
jgi:hypothetical protein